MSTELNTLPLVAVHLHMYDPNLTEKIVGKLKLIPIPFDLFVTTPIELSGKLQSDLTHIARKVSLIKTPTLDRDLLPFIQLIHLENIDAYSIILKVHSYHNITHPDDYNETLSSIEEVLSNKERVEAIVNTLHSSEHIGAIGPRKDLNFYTYKDTIEDLKEALSYLDIPSYDLVFFQKSIFWCKGASLKKIKNLPFNRYGLSNKSTAEDTIERLLGILTSIESLQLAPVDNFGYDKKGEFKLKDFVKIFCFFLPQFHEIPENNSWWGQGFTEWSNLRKAQPLYNGHNILRPHKSIGEYNLLSKDTRRKQGIIAKNHGVHAFCYHHYWFGGKKLLERPTELLLKDGEPDLPFFFNWANEPWSRTWDGLESDVLMPQNYGQEDDWQAHLEYLVTFFQHPNYYKVDGMPIISLYRIGHIENYDQMILYWKKVILSMGFPGLKVYMILGNFDESQPTNIITSNIDGMIEFQPQYTSRFPNTHATIANTPCWQISTPPIWEIIENTPKIHKNHFKGTFPSWDNTIRKGKKGRTYSLEPVDLFKNHLKRIIKISLENPCEDGIFIFINAWNEWAEGAVLEPSESREYQLLEAVNQVLDLDFDPQRRTILE